jgi:hypothetical protein
MMLQTESQWQCLWRTQIETQGLRLPQMLLAPQQAGERGVAVDALASGAGTPNKRLN